ncbi:MAG: hypothetical protein QOH04_163 [Sphingomonadales bacterium]|nr:hypothetical protein [Sphingomonadales bacterium]
MEDSPAQPAHPNQTSAAAPARQRWLTPERVIGIIGIATAVYYIAAFAFEVGFFWEIGPVYMSAFSMADHIAHAATMAMISAGATLVGITIYVLAVVLGADGVRTAAAEAAPAPEPVIPAEKSKRSRLAWAAFWTALVAGAFYLGTWPKLSTAPGPVSLLETAACLFFLTLIYVESRPEAEHASAAIYLSVPVVLSVALLPSAWGEWTYRGVIEHPAPVPLILGTARINRGSAVFVGSSRLIVATDRGLYLLSDDGTFRLRIKG